MGALWRDETQKLRVILIKRADLESLFDEGSEEREIAVIEDSHRARIETLRRMFELWTSSHQEDRDMICEVELGIATHGQIDDPFGHHASHAE